MRRKNSLWIFGGSVVLVLILACWLLTRGRVSPQSLPHRGGFEGMPFRKPPHEVAFYGRIVDQHNDPVAGMVVKLNVDQQMLNLTTDDKGFFGIEGASGQYLSINYVEKEGYMQPAYGGAGGTFAYAPEEPKRHHPNPAKPVVMHVWKMEGNPGPLLRFGIRDQMPLDGEPYTFDVTRRYQHQRVAAKDGDFSISLSRTDDGKDHWRVNWLVTLRAVDGGFVDHPNDGAPVGWIAPENGYKPELKLTDRETAPPGRCVFFRSRNGSFCGMFTVETSLDTPQKVQVSIWGRLSPTGSRNLETDASHSNVVAKYEELKNYKPRPVPKVPAGRR